MITPITPPASHVVAAAFEGDITKDDVGDIVEMIEAALENSERVNLFFDFTQLEGVKPSAVLKDLAFSLRNLGRLYRFQQMAIITDNESLGKIIEWEDWLFKSVEIKRFPSQERDHALNWIEKRLELPSPGFSAESEGEFLRLKMGELLTGYDVMRLAELVESEYKDKGPVRILVQMESVPKLGQGVLYEKLRQFKLMSLIDRVAYVGPDSLKSQIKAFNSVLHCHLKHFTAEQVSEAEQWIRDLSPSVEVLPTDSEHQFALRISGKITSVEVETSYAALLPHLKGDNSMDLLLEVPYQDGITLNALYQAVKLGIKHYSKVTQGIRRLAIITDSRFLSKATEVENLLISSVEERPFTFAQREIALAWLSEGRPNLEASTTTHLPTAQQTKLLQSFTENDS